MNFGRKRFIIFIIISVLIWTGTVTNGLSRIINNHSPEAYIDDGDQFIKKMGSNNIDSLVIEGAGYFLASQAAFFDYTNLLNSQELAQDNDLAIRQSLLVAKDNLENAKNTYCQLIQIAETTPYKEAIISQLSVFNYSEFQGNNGLNPDLFSQVEYYLKNGDITGIYKNTYNHLNEISQDLYLLAESMENGESPPPASLQKLIDLFNNTHRRGQYVARIFFEIKQSL